MAVRPTGGFHPEPDTALIVINAQLAHLSHEAGGRALVPEHLAAAAEVMRLSIHVTDHEQLATSEVSRVGWHDSAGVKLRREIAAFLDLFNGEARGEWICGGHGSVVYGFFARIRRKMSCGTAGLVLASEDFDGSLIEGIHKIGLVRRVLALKTEQAQGASDDDGFIDEGSILLFCAGLLNQHDLGDGRWPAVVTTDISWQDHALCHVINTLKRSHKADDGDALAVQHFHFRRIFDGGVFFAIADDDIGFIQQIPISQNGIFRFGGRFVSRFGHSGLGGEFVLL